MTPYITPSIFLIVFLLCAWQFRAINRESAVFFYKPFYYWRRFLAAVSPTGLDQLEDGVVVLNKLYRIVDVNVVAAELLQQTAVTLIGQPLADICPLLGNKFEEITQRKSEIICDHRPGRIYELSLKPLTSWPKKTNGFLLIMSDVTEQKHLESMRRDMTHTLVHDLRAPLSNSIFALQMLEMHLNGHATPEASRMIGMTISNTEKVLDRVNKILDIERLESQQMPLAFSAVSLPTLIENVLAVQSSRITEKELDIVCYIPEALASVWADCGLLERVLQNLIDNSIKFTPSGGEIVIGVTAVTHSNPAAVHVSIADTGTGIPADLQKTIFEKFVGTNAKGSSGLGLAFCKKTLIAHGQDIWVESEPGQGSIFTFSLALADQPHHQPQQIPA